jgi:hypothetical protein
MNLQNEDVKTALYDMMVLLAETAEATVDLLERTVGFVSGVGLISLLRINASVRRVPLP